MSLVKTILRPVRRALMWPAVAGDRYWCPNCKRGARRFLSAGTPTRPAARCPWCGMLERHRMVATYLDSLAAPKAVLHVAPERMLAQQLRSQAARYVSVDLNNSADLTADISLPLPFGDGEFDLILCSHVLEHIPDDAAAIRNLARVLAPGGHLLVLVPVFDADHTYEEPFDDPADRLRVYGQEDHVRLYGRDVIDRLRAGGLAVEQLAWSTTPTSDLERIRVDANAGDIYVCRQPGL